MQFVALHVLEIVHMTAFVKIKSTEDSPASFFSTDSWAGVFLNFKFPASRFVVSITRAPISFSFGCHY